MKRAISIVAAAALCAAGAWAFGTGEQGRGEDGEAGSFGYDASFDAEDFRSIRAEGTGDVVFRRGDGFRVKATASSRRLLKSARADVDGGTLRLHQAPFLFFPLAGRLRWEVTAPALEGISISGTGSFSAEDALEADVVRVRVSGTGSARFESRSRKFECGLSGTGKVSARVDADEVELRLSGTGSFEGELEADEVGAELSGTGGARLEGGARTLTARLGGTGSLDARGMEVDRADVAVSGTGGMKIAVREELSAAVSGTGTVVYYGSPRVDARASGLGEVKKGD